MLNTRKILYWAVTAVCCGLLPFGCVKKDAPTLGEQHNAVVQLYVGTRAVGETDGTPTDEEKAIHTLRVYAFVDGKPAGHYYTDQVTGDTHFMDLTFYSVTQNVNFYAVANEQAMTGSSSALLASTSESRLNNLWFTGRQTDIQRYGLPMYFTEIVPLEFKGVGNSSPNDSDHADHPLLNTKISIELKRPFGKLGVFAAKPTGEKATLRVTGLTMLESGTRTYNYLMPQADEKLKEIDNITGGISLPVVGENVTAELSGDIAPEERKNPKNYTPVLNAPCYLFENPYKNGGAWYIPGNDRKEHVLKIDYTFDNEPRSGYVYMPAVERNTYYPICCLMHNDGKITVEYSVADWDDGGYYDIEFNYPQYTNPIQPADGSTPPESGKYPQPEVWYSNDGSGKYTFKFQITGPKGQKWTPTLVGALGTQDNFAVKVYQGEAPKDENGYLYDNTRNNDNNDRLVASPDPYFITVEALKNDNINQEVGLAIAYERNWSSDGSAMLLINGLTNNLKWEGSNVAEVIMIKQTANNQSTIND